MWTKRYARLVDMLVPNIIDAPASGTFHSRADNRLQAERLARENGSFEEWQPDVQKLTADIEDDKMRQLQAARLQHKAVSGNQNPDVVPLDTHHLITEHLQLLPPERVAR